MIHINIRICGSFPLLTCHYFVVSSVSQPADYYLRGRIDYEVHKHCRTTRKRLDYHQQKQQFCIMIWYWQSLKRLILECHIAMDIPTPAPLDLSLWSTERDISNRYSLLVCMNMSMFDTKIQFQRYHHFMKFMIWTHGFDLSRISDGTLFPRHYNLGEIHESSSPINMCIQTRYELAQLSVFKCIFNDPIRTKLIETAKRVMWLRRLIFWVWPQNAFILSNISWFCLKCLMMLLVFCWYLFKHAITWIFDYSCCTPETYDLYM